MATDKAALRRLFKERRKLLKSQERDEEIARAFLASKYAKAESFFIYVSIGTEAATEAIISALCKQGKTVCVPRIVGDTMVAAPYAALVKGEYGIPAPENGEDTPCAVTLAPLLAFDRAGYRLGYGKGYYDKYFVTHSTVQIGLAYAGQAENFLPHDGHDVKLEAVVTEEGVIIFS